MKNSILPPSNFSASKAKGVSTNTRLMLGYTESKGLKKAQPTEASKTRLAVIGNNMVTEPSPGGNLGSS